MTAELKVVTLRETNLRDVPAMLRKLADAIEQGDHGHVTCCALALLGRTFDVFAFGDSVDNDGMAPSAALMFHAAALRFAKEIEQTGVE